MEFEIPSVTFNTLNFNCGFGSIHDFVFAFKICIDNNFSRQTFDKVFNMCVKSFKFYFEIIINGVAIHTESSGEKLYHWIGIVEDKSKYGLDNRSYVDFGGYVHYTRGEIFRTDYEIYCQICFKK